MPGDLDHPEDLEDGEDTHQPLDVGEPTLLLLLPLLHHPSLLHLILDLLKELGYVT